MGLTIDLSVVDKAVAALKAKAGNFLGAQQRLFEIGDRLNAIATSGTDIAKKEAALQIAEQKLLLKRQNDLESRTLSTIQNAAAVKSETEGIIAQFKGFTSIASLGTRVLEIWQNQGNKVLVLSRDGLTLAKEIDAHMSDVSKLEKAVFKNQATAVTGSTASNIFSGASEILGKLKWLAVSGAAIYGMTLLAPFVRARR